MFVQLCCSPGKHNPLQYPCLEKSMDRGAWQATVQGISRISKLVLECYYQVPAIREEETRKMHPRGLPAARGLKYTNNYITSYLCRSMCNAVMVCIFTWNCIFLNTYNFLNKIEMPQIIPDSIRFYI